MIDIGSGTSLLIDYLLDEGYQHITALDIADSALAVAKQRLADRSVLVEWIVGDIRTVALTAHTYDLWHDRAAFHFLTLPEDRAAYLRTLRHALKADGQLVMATFADDGPETCSNLNVMRYSPETLSTELGADFELVESARVLHLTPWNSEQRFIHCRFRRV
jgi:ubiquinone/menaquinone biosynthesis C-methylase UbiE